MISFSTRKLGLLYRYTMQQQLTSTLTYKQFSLRQRPQPLRLLRRHKSLLTDNLCKLAIQKLREITMDDLDPLHQV
jgi:hypothetical protein